MNEKNEIILGRDLEAETRAIATMAQYVAKSGLFGVKTPEQAVALMLLARAEGLHPMQAVREYHIIDGRPSMRADAMLAKFQQAGGRIQWVERSDTAAEAVFYHPQGGEVRVRWTIEDAQRAGLAGRDNWKKYPRQMLSARVISEGVRAVYPAVVVGVYTPEEVSDFVETPASQPEVSQPEEAVEVEAAPAQASAQEERASQAQLKLIHALLGELGIEDREERLKLASLVVGRELGSSTELTKKEASRLIELLKELQAANLSPEAIRGALREDRLPLLL